MKNTSSVPLSNLYDENWKKEDEVGKHLKVHVHLKCVGYNNKLKESETQLYIYLYDNTVKRNALEAAEENQVFDNRCLSYI